MEEAGYLVKRSKRLKRVKRKVAERKHLERKWRHMLPPNDIRYTRTEDKGSLQAEYYE